MASNALSIAISADISDLQAKLIAVQQGFQALGVQLAASARTAQGSSAAAYNAITAQAAKADADRRRADQEWASAQQSLNQQVYQSKLLELDQEVALGQITTNQKLQMERSLVAEKTADDRAWLQSELGRNDLSLAEAEKYKIELKKLNESSSIEIQKINLQQIQSQEKVWDDFSNRIGDDFGRIFQGIGEKGFSISKNLTSLFSSTADEIATDGVKALAKWALMGASFAPQGLLGDLTALFSGDSSINKIAPATGAFSTPGAVGSSAQTASLITNTAGAAGTATSATQDSAVLANTTALTTLTTSVTALNATMTGHSAVTTTATGATTLNTGATTVNSAGQSVNSAATTVNSAATTTNSAGLLTSAATWLENTVATIANTVATDAAAIGSFLGFADGGDPPVGVPSLVGERGPELFVPRGAGTIISNDNLRRMGSLRYVGLPSGGRSSASGSLTAAQMVQNAISTSSSVGGDIHLSQTIHHAAGGRQSDAESLYEAAMRGGRRGAQAIRRALR
jgi:hypothetical protein